MRIVYFIILFKFVCNYAKNQGLTNSLANISHENLLDNPWFTVNQRGQSTYSFNYGYTLDRWKIENQSLNVTTNSDGTITITNNGSDNGQLLQKLEKPLLSNMKGTLSIDVISYTGNVKVFYALAVSPWNGLIYFTVDKTGIISKAENIPNLSSYGEGETKVFISLDAGASITVKAIKLETGSVSTLHMDSAPNYQQELAKCQRYYEQNSWYSWNVKANLDGVIDVMTSYPFLVKKRVNNITTNILKQNIGNGQLVDLTTSTLIPSNEVTISQPVAYNSRMESIKITHNSIISGHTYYFSIGDDCIAFSADL